MNTALQNIQTICLPIFKQFGVTKAAVFGSVSRGEETKDSDVDFLVSLKRPVGLIKLNLLQIAIENALQKKIDLVEYEGMNHILKPYILQDAQTIYEE